MSDFTAKSFRNHEQVLFHQDPASGLRAIIAIHDTTLGPALGGLQHRPAVRLAAQSIRPSAASALWRAAGAAAA